jgi:signal transduction histidine kinase/CheY-like chemotaxis protein/ABC-type amino acid transport substrate-binding protein
MKKIRCYTFFTAIFLALTLIFSFTVPVYADTESITTVKVGYFKMEGYNEIDDDGLYSGYDYDFFQMLGRYTNLNFEYVGYDKSWQEMQEMLDNGEIDILTSMHYTEERSKKYDFSYDIGSSYTMLTIKIGDERFKSGDYTSYNGMVVGMLSESSQNSVFEDFAEEKGFSYSAVYFENTAELSDAIQSGIVDAAVTSSLRQLHGERVIDEIDTSQFYAAVKKGNTELIDEINQGISQMDLYNGDWRNTLYYRYYGYQDSSVTEITYSDRERDVISEYSNGDNLLKVCFDPSLAPYSFVSDGNMVGILPDAIAETLEELGINYEFVIAENHDEYIRMYENGEADVFPETVADSTPSAQENYLFTDSYFTMRIGMITGKSGHRSIDKIALLDNGNFYNDLTFSGKKVVMYSSADEVVNAVINGSADAAYLMNYTAQMYINNEKIGELAYVSQPDMHYDISFAVNRNIPHEICSILNKNLGVLSAEDFYSLSLEYISDGVKDITFIEYMQLHPKTAFMLFLLVMIMVIVIMILFFINNRKTEREKQQQDLQKAYERTESALADAQQYRHAVLSDAFVIYDANISRNLIEKDVCEEYGETKYCIFESLGLTAPCSYDEYIRKVCENMTESDDRETFRRKTSREYLTKIFAEGKTEDVFEYRTKLINGQIADIRHTTYLTRNNGENDIIAHINKKNITAQKKNERQIRKYEQILITTATDTYKGVRRVDLDTQQAEYINFNGKIKQTDIGNWTEWLEGQRVNIHPDDFDRIRNFLSIENLSSMQTGIPYRQDYRSHDVNEKKVNRVYTTTVSVMYVEEKKIAVMTTIDNTAAVESEIEQKRLVEDALRSAEKANTAKTTFLSNMSHDIRTPMNAIIGFTSLAETHIDNTEQVKDYLSKISASSHHLLSLINDVLDMSRIESGRLHLDETEFNLSDFVHNIQGIIMPDLTAKELNFTVDMSGVSDDSVICDKLRLNRVILNLLGNAIKFTENGGNIKLLVDETNSDGKDTAIYEFHVSDTGIGMSEEFISHVFEPFERERNSTVSGVQGTGLGMSISKNIVDMMGGTISVSSVKGEGTEFTVIIPMKKTNPDNITIEVEETIHSRNNIHGQRILLVEDNDMNREIAAEILGSAGLVVEEAEDGSVAVDMLLNKGAGYYTLVLMDIQMPIMDGYTATKRIRSFEDKELAKIPIIAMTANAFEEDKQNALAAGMNAHLAKPISVDLLLDTLEQIFGNMEQ